MECKCISFAKKEEKMRAENDINKKNNTATLNEME